jgi:hypothetical protein
LKKSPSVIQSRPLLASEPARLSWSLGKRLVVSVHPRWAWGRRWLASSASSSPGPCSGGLAKFVNYEFHKVNLPELSAHLSQKDILLGLLASTSPQASHASARSGSERQELGHGRCIVSPSFSINYLLFFPYFHSRNQSLVNL